MADSFSQGHECGHSTGWGTAFARRSWLRGVLEGEANMSKSWMGMMLVVAGLSQAPAALGQHLPSGPGPAPMPDPMPCGPSQQMIPGPISPFAAPPGPPDELGIPASVPGAFRDDWYCPEKCVYFHAGAMALQRRRPGRFPIALIDPVNVDTGTANALGSSLTQDLSQVHPHFAWGPRATIGLLFDGCALEATGYYLPQTSSSTTTTNPGSLDTFFTNPPVGFEGNNGLWTQADRITTTLRTTLGNAEVNYRWWCPALTGCDLLFGIRYFDQQERLSIGTDDDGVALPGANGRPDPLRQATYSILAHNRIVGPQLGMEWQYNCLKCLSCGFYAKGAWGVNFVDVDISLTRGDGLVGFDGGRNNTIYSSLYDLGGFIELQVLERLRIRSGYNALWLIHVPVANQQLDFNLQRTTGARKDNGSVFYQGPLFELQFLF